MTVKNLDTIKKVKVTAGNDTYMQVLISAEEGPNFAMRRFVIEPGGRMPEHTNLVEHEQFVLKGHAKVGIAENLFEVKQNDVVFIPAGVPHWYEPLGTEPFEFLCMVPNTEDKVEIIGE